MSSEESPLACPTPLPGLQVTALKQKPTLRESSSKTCHHHYCVTTNLVSSPTTCYQGTSPLSLAASRGSTLILAKLGFWGAAVSLGWLESTINKPTNGEDKQDQSACSCSTRLSYPQFQATSSTHKEMQHQNSYYYYSRRDF